MNPTPECSSLDYPEAYFLAGPTAVGKTTVAHVLAQTMGAAILSADSMLVYRGMDIGTAKPTSEERSDVEYLGVDLADPDQPFSVAEYMEAIREPLNDCRSRGLPIIVAGGTGLYIKCLLMALLKSPRPTRLSERPWRI